MLSISLPTTRTLKENPHKNSPQSRRNMIYVLCIGKRARTKKMADSNTPSECLLCSSELALFAEIWRCNPCRISGRLNRPGTFARNDGPQTVVDTRTWSPLIWRWEKFKAVNNIATEEYERIPESFLRDTLAAQSGVSSPDVSEEQIDVAARELCHQYGRFLMIPLPPNDQGPAHNQAMEPHVVAGPGFWKARENEFRKHDTAANTALLAIWFSTGDLWKFRAGSGVGPPQPGAEHIFKSQARVAAEGFAGSSYAERWIVWLNALARATDGSTGERYYCKVTMTGSMVLSEEDLAHKTLSGEFIPPVGLIEFMMSEGSTAGSAATSSAAGGGTIKRRRFWDTSVEEIAGLFTASANYCLYLRSLAEQKRKERQIVTDLNAEYARRLSGGDGPEVGRQRNLLRDARQYTAKFLDQAVSDFQLPAHPADIDIEAACSKIRDRLVIRAWDDFLSRPKDKNDIRMGFIEFEAALWSEGFPSGGSPSLNDRVTGALQERAVTAIREPLPESPSGREESLGTAEYVSKPAGSTTGTLDELLELPGMFQDRFETAKAKAELDYANRAEMFPHNPELAELPINYLVLIQKVFFAYCAEARRACKEGHWSVRRTRQATEAALSIVSDHYFIRKHGDRSDDRKVACRAIFAEGVSLDQQGKQHLAELVELAGTASTVVNAEREVSQTRKTKPEEHTDAWDAGAAASAVGAGDSPSNAQIVPTQNLANSAPQHPGSLPKRTWARVQAIKAGCIAKLRGGATREKAICVAIQECYNVLIEERKRQDGCLPELVLTVATRSRF